MRKRRPIELFSISFLDLLSGALGAVIILYVAIPKNHLPLKNEKKPETDKLNIELSLSRQKISKLEAELEITKKMMSEKLTVPTQITAESTPPDKFDDVGFKFKGKEIVFIVDTSYSMTEEDRMGQVKAGIKMLLTSLGGSYKVDIVQFPLGERAPFRSMWGDTKEFKGMNRADAFDFIYSLKPLGGTPTRDTLLFVLENYENISDIILLTDGAPTLHNSNTKDDINEILKDVRSKNVNKVQINTIGVGQAFLKDKNSEQFKFLNSLSLESSGFFVVF